jgi:hypothetical protein
MQSIVKSRPVEVKSSERNLDDDEEGGMMGRRGFGGR